MTENSKPSFFGKIPGVSSRLWVLVVLFCFRPAVLAAALKGAFS